MSDVKSIGFFGDSFCATIQNEHSVQNKYQTYISKLQQNYQCNVVNLGIDGSSVWDSYLLQFKKFQYNLPQVCVFIWTSPGRIFHRQVRNINISDALEPDNHKHDHSVEGKNFYNELLNPNNKSIWESARLYYKYLQDDEKEELEYTSFLYYLDQQVFNQISKQTKIIHCWSFGQIKNWDLNSIMNFKDQFHLEWTTGCTIKPSLLHLSLKDHNLNILQTDPRANHIEGEEKNQILFNVLKTAIDTDKDEVLYFDC